MAEQQQLVEPDMDFPNENWSPRRYEVLPRHSSDYVSRLKKGGVFLENPDESISKGLLGRRGRKRFITVPDETYFGWAEWDHLKSASVGDRYAIGITEKTYQEEVAVPINNWTEFLIIRHIKSTEKSEEGS